ncbi:MAG: hypothetical protein RLY86_1991 [Pseudomonadota bacterium]|jgi:hypothetical protein
MQISSFSNSSLILSLFSPPSGTTTVPTSFQQSDDGQAVAAGRGFAVSALGWAGILAPTTPTLTQSTVLLLSSVGEAADADQDSANSNRRAAIDSLVSQLQQQTAAAQTVAGQRARPATPALPSVESPDRTINTTPPPQAAPAEGAPERTPVRQGDVVGSVTSRAVVEGNLQESSVTVTRVGDGVTFDRRSLAISGGTLASTNFNITASEQLAVTSGSARWTDVDGAGGQEAAFTRAVTTGNGADQVEISSYWRENPALVAQRSTIDVATGAGDDTVRVDTAGNAGGRIAVDGGSGNDSVRLDGGAGAALDVTGGQGNDTIIFNGAGANATIRGQVDGGQDEVLLSSDLNSFTMVLNDASREDLIANLENGALTLTYGATGAGFTIFNFDANKSTLRLFDGDSLSGANLATFIAAGGAYQAASNLNNQGGGGGGQTV